MTGTPTERAISSEGGSPQTRGYASSRCKCGVHGGARASTGDLARPPRPHGAMLRLLTKQASRAFSPRTKLWGNPPVLPWSGGGAGPECSFGSPLYHAAIVLMTVLWGGLQVFDDVVIYPEA